MKRGWQLTALCLVALSAFAAWIGVFGLAALNSRPLPLQDTLGPGPGFFPIWLNGIIVVLGLLLAVQVTVASAADEAPPFPVPAPGLAIKLAGATVLVLATIFHFPGLPVLAALGLGSQSVLTVLAYVLAAGCALLLALWPARYPADSDAGSILRIAAIIGLLALAAAALDPLGFRITVLAFSVLALIALGIRSVPIIAVFALIAGLGVFYVFYYELKVPLPIGPYDHIFKPLEALGNSLWSLLGKAIA